MERKHKQESSESLFRRFKKGIEKTDIINEVKKREHYVKSTTRRKLAKEVARKNEKQRQEDQNTNRTLV